MWLTTSVEDLGCIPSDFFLCSAPQRYHLPQQEPVRTVIAPTPDGNQHQFPREENDEVEPGQLMGPFKRGGFLFL